ncbi:hypothetical protein [Reichenbachiella agariperforans]|uniref:Protein TonB, links inner and outer membranes n=1 Tax=Reichenbachiella agariperforans TaxID=156994 RepID=A0A1M6SIB3_REIAG|nr:hypothetical protein [Reichenbachiella agariperforans]MBU2916154.1 hypothetical protein [Reichenbachiella agariperforans]SHK44512.1 hypothetical protein SAMN04488028_10532 [Reichenbachiella agariperforans]
MNLREKKNRITGVYVSVGIHTALLLIFFFVLAWREPDPPIPEYGIEFNLGNEIISDSESDVPVQAEQIDEVEEVQEAEEAEETSEASDAASNEEPVEPEVEETNEPTEETAETEDINSPDIVEKKVEEKKVEKKEVVKAEAEQKEETSEKKEEAKKVVSKPKIDDRAIFKKSDAGGGSGNKGASLDLSGWAWDFRPEPDDNSTEEGYIVFEIKVDDEGEIVAIRTIEKTVSPVVERIYRDAVMELTFSKTADNRNSASTSTGRITFIIQSK